MHLFQNETFSAINLILRINTQALKSVSCSKLILRTNGIYSPVSIKLLTILPKTNEIIAHKSWFSIPEIPYRTKNRNLLRIDPKIHACIQLFQGADPSILPLCNNIPALKYHDNYKPVINLHDLNSIFPTTDSSW